MHVPVVTTVPCPVNAASRNHGHRFAGQPGSAGYVEGFETGDGCAVTAVGWGGERKGNNLRHASQQGVHAASQLRPAFAVNHPDFQDSPLPGFEHILRQQGSKILGPEGMEIEFPVDGKFCGVWRGLFHGRRRSYHPNVVADNCSGKHF